MKSINITPTQSIQRELRYKDVIHSNLDTGAPISKSIFKENISSITNKQYLEIVFAANNILVIEGTGPILELSGTADGTNKEL